MQQIVEPASHEQLSAGVFHHLAYLLLVPGMVALFRTVLTLGFIVKSAVQPLQKRVCTQACTVLTEHYRTTDGSGDIEGGDRGFRPLCRAVLSLAEHFDESP